MNHYRYRDYVYWVHVDHNILLYYYYNLLTADINQRRLNAVYAVNINSLKIKQCNCHSVLLFWVFSFSPRVSLCIISSHSVNTGEIAQKWEISWGQNACGGAVAGDNSRGPTAERGLHSMWEAAGPQSHYLDPAPAQASATRTRQSWSGLEQSCQRARRRVRGRAARKNPLSSLHSPRAHFGQVLKRSRAPLAAVQP